MMKLYHVVTNNINIKDQCSDDIANDIKFGNKLSLSSDSNKYPFPVATVTIRGGN